jgi:hypothetical protein
MHPQAAPSVAVGGLDCHREREREPRDKDPPKDTDVIEEVQTTDAAKDPPRKPEPPTKRGRKAPSKSHLSNIKLPQEIPEVPAVLPKPPPGPTHRSTAKSATTSTTTAATAAAAAAAAAAATIKAAPESKEPDSPDTKAAKMRARKREEKKTLLLEEIEQEKEIAQLEAALKASKNANEGAAVVEDGEQEESSEDEDVEEVGRDHLQPVMAAPIFAEPQQHHQQQQQHRYQPIAPMGAQPLQQALLRYAHISPQHLTCHVCVASPKSKLNLR